MKQQKQNLWLNRKSYDSARPDDHIVVIWTACSMQLTGNVHCFCFSLLETWLTLCQPFIYFALEILYVL